MPRVTREFSLTLSKHRSSVRNRSTALAQEMSRQGRHCPFQLNHAFKGLVIYRFGIHVCFYYYFRICKKMFRTELDLKLKVQGKSGSPFFNLRDTIFILLNKHLEETKVCLELQVFVKVS